jgi:hypothetical protein
MTLKEANQLLPGDCLTVNFSGEKDETGYIIAPQDIIIFSKVIPKVRVERIENRSWKDGSKMMILGRRVTGERCWLNLCNTKLFSEPRKKRRLDKVS